MNIHRKTRLHIVSLLFIFMIIYWNNKASETAAQPNQDRRDPKETILLFVNNCFDLFNKESTSLHIACYADNFIGTRRYFDRDTLKAMSEYYDYVDLTSIRDAQIKKHAKFYNLKIESVRIVNGITWEVRIDQRLEVEGQVFAGKRLIYMYHNVGTGVIKIFSEKWIEKCEQDCDATTAEQSTEVSEVRDFLRYLYGTDRTPKEIASYGIIKIPEPANLLLTTNQDQSRSVRLAFYIDFDCEVVDPSPLPICKRSYKIATNGGVLRTSEFQKRAEWYANHYGSVMSVGGHGLKKPFPFRSSSELIQKIVEIGRALKGKNIKISEIAIFSHGLNYAIATKGDNESWPKISRPVPVCSEFIQYDDKTGEEIIPVLPGCGVTFSTGIHINRYKHGKSDQAATRKKGFPTADDIINLNRAANLESFVFSIKNYLRNDVKILLFACLTASDQRPAEVADSRLKRVDNPRGNNSFAYAMAHELATQGLTEATVYGHVTSGHVTENASSIVYGYEVCRLGAEQIIQNQDGSKFCVAHHGIHLFNKIAMDIIANDLKRAKSSNSARQIAYREYNKLVANPEQYGGLESFADSDKVKAAFRQAWSKARRQIPGLVKQPEGV